MKYDTSCENYVGNHTSITEDDRPGIALYDTILLCLGMILIFLTHSIVSSSVTSCIILLIIIWHRPSIGNMGSCHWIVVSVSMRLLHNSKWIYNYIQQKCTRFRDFRIKMKIVKWCVQTRYCLSLSLISLSYPYEIWDGRVKRGDGTIYSLCAKQVTCLVRTIMAQFTDTFIGNST